MTFFLRYPQMPPQSPGRASSSQATKALQELEFGARSSVSSHLALVATSNVSNLEHLVKPKSCSKQSLLLDSKKLKGNRRAFQCWAQGPACRGCPITSISLFQGEGDYLHSLVRESLGRIPTTAPSTHLSRLEPPVP